MIINKKTRILFKGHFKAIGWEEKKRRDLLGEARSICMHCVVPAYCMSDYTDRKTSWHVFFLRCLGV